MKEEAAGCVPKIARSAALHKLCYVSGEVEICDRASVWPFAVLRGDAEKITVGECSNVQDNAVLHASAGHPVVLGKYVSVGHGAIVHGAEVEDCTVVGMSAIVLDGAHVGKGCIVGAGCVIPSGKRIPDYSVVVGNPYRVLRNADAAEAEDNRRNAKHYVELSESFRGADFL